MLAQSKSLYWLKPCLLALITICFIVSAIKAHADQSITLRTGNAPAQTSTDPTPRDAQVRFHAYGAFGNVTPTAADFAAAQTGDFAYINRPFTTYVQQLPTDPLAQWIGTSSGLGGGSALYAIPFTVTDTVIGSASLNLGFAVDNRMDGVYLNGQPLSNNPVYGDYHSEWYALNSDIAPLIHTGVNWLYLNDADDGAIAGLIFNATITIQGGSASVPSITPNSGGDGSVTVRIVGSDFQAARPVDVYGDPAVSGSSLAFTGPGGSIGVSNINIVNPNFLTATLDLTKASPGLWSWIITNPDKTTVSLPNSFTVLASGACNAQIQTIATPPVLGRLQTYFVSATNAGNIDCTNIPMSVPLEPWQTFVSFSPVPPIPSLSPLNAPTSVGWTWPSIAPGQTVTQTIVIGQNPNFPAGQISSLFSCATPVPTLTNPIAGAHFKACDVVYHAALDALQEPGNPCADEAGPDGPQFNVPCSLAVNVAYQADYLCMRAGPTTCSEFSAPVLGALDPNNITGPAGFGIPGWFIPKAPFQYALSFSNEATATNPATNVYLTDTFSPSQFQLNTLSIVGIATGASNYAPTLIPLTQQPFTHDIDLRPALPYILRVNASLNSTTGQVSVSLLTLDPATGMEPTDATKGFLPPGAGGTVLFSVAPKTPYATGTKFTDSGSVVFDSNPVINTPTWTNTVDINPPVSHVLSLPAKETTASFGLSWTGTDVGSGIQSFTIYVSDNGGPFAAWLTGSNGLSTTYPGVTGHTYSFYSIATDVAGNVEAPKTIAEATTTVSVPTGTDNQIQVSLNASTIPYRASTVVTVKILPGPDPAHAPKGTAELFVDGSAVTTLNLGGAGHGNAAAYYNLSGLGAGSHNLYAVYSGDTLNAPGTSQIVQLQVVPAPVRIPVSCINPVLISGDDYVCKVFTEPIDAGSNTAITYQYDNGAPVVAPLNGGLASFSISKPPVGSHTVVISYAAQGNYAAATPQTESFTVEARH